MTPDMQKVDFLLSENAEKVLCNMTVRESQ